MPKLRLTPRAALLALVLSACHYDPVIPEGVECHENPDCPAGYACVAKPGTEIKVCCRTMQCGFQPLEPDASPPAPDAKAAPPPDAAASIPPDAGADGAVELAADVAPPAPDAAGDLAAPDLPPDVTAPPDLAPDLSPDTGPSCPAARGGPALVRAGSFCVDSTEVTNEQYAAFLADKTSDVSGQPAACKWNTSYVPDTDGLIWPYLTGRGNFPVANVDWCDAYAFCKWSGKRLCGKVGGGRLATVTAAAGTAGQWFNACTNGGRLTYPYGAMLNRVACNIGAPSDAAMYVEEVKHRATCQGGYPGLFDMGGNLEEWVDGCDKDTGSADNCAVAGSSSWTGDLTPDDLSCSGSVFGSPRNTRFYLLGFRCCAD